MSNMDDAKRTYDAIEIPEELSERVQEAIRVSQRKQKSTHMRNRKKIFVRSMETAAALAIGFTVLLNANTAFAKEMSEIPVVGAIARVLTFRSFEESNEDMSLSVEIPKMEMDSENGGNANGLTDSVNQEIQRLCDEYLQEAQQRALEYKKAFLETGGTEEEWEKHHIGIDVWYEVKSQTPDYLSFVVMGNENWSSAYDVSKYYTIDLKSEKLVTLADLLGENYINITNANIQSQFSAKEQEIGMEFFTPEEGGFTSITEDTPFYVNEAGNPVVVFKKYEIAPGAAGEITFCNYKIIQGQNNRHSSKKSV